MTTSFRDPSESITIGTLDDREVAFLPRHGSDHQHTPTNALYKANIYALKKIGVERVLASNAVGGLQETSLPQMWGYDGFSWPVDAIETRPSVEVEIPFPDELLTAYEQELRAAFKRD